MAKKFLTGITIATAVGGEYTFPIADGSANQAIVTDGNGNLSFGSAIASTAEDAQRLVCEMINASGSSISAFRPVCCVGIHSDGTPEIALARADNPLFMPAIGITQSSVGNNNRTDVLLYGKLEGVNTTPYATGDTLYVAPTGGWTTTRPTGNNLIQAVFKVGRIQQNNGSGGAFGAGQYQDLPNVPEGNVWIGNSNSYPIATPLSTAIPTALGFTPVTNARTITINGTSFDLTANRSWTVSGSDSTKLPLAGGTMTGKIFTVSTGTGTYDTAIEIRETSYATTSQSAWGYSPALTFHWGGRFAKRFGMRSDGLFAVDDEPLALRSWVSSQGYITGSYLPLSGGTVTGDVTFGNNSTSDQGIKINYGNYSSGYGRIRFLQDGTNHNTIHSFSASWQGGTLQSASSGAINLDGQNGVTIGPWNNPSVWVNNSGTISARVNLSTLQVNFRNSSNNAFFTGNSDWGVRLANDNGYIQFGPANGGWTHIYSDKSFYFNQDLYIYGNRVYGDHYRPYADTAGNLSGFDKTNPSFGAVYASNWFRGQGDCGLYSQDYGGHIRRTVNAAHGTWEIFGYNKGSYAGLNIQDPQGYYNNYMHEGGNGGLYSQNYRGDWIWYHGAAANCTAFNGSSNDGGVRFRVNGSARVTGDFNPQGYTGFGGNVEWPIGYTQYHGTNTAYNWRDWGGWGGYWWSRNGGDMIMNLYAVYAVTGSISDMRYKKDVTSLPYGLNELMQLNPIKYHYDLPKESMLANDPDYFLGFSAQEVQGIIPEAVHEKIAEDSENMKGMLAITMNELIPVTVQAIKEQQVMIHNQGIKIQKLEALVNQLLNN